MGGLDRGAATPSGGDAPDSDPEETRDWIESLDAVIVNAAGCGAMLKDYDHLLHDTPHAAAGRKLASKVRDICEFLVHLGPVKPEHPLPLGLLRPRERLRHLAGRASARADREAARGRRRGR